MYIIGDRKFVEIPGNEILELPPLLVKYGDYVPKWENVVYEAAIVIEQEDWVPAHPLDDYASQAEVERRKFDLAINTVKQYKQLLRHWHYGDGILEWVRQCEITFESKACLRKLLKPDVWPHAGKSSFVTLLKDKNTVFDAKENATNAKIGGIDIENAVGFRLTFREPPPITYFSDQYLFYLNGTLAHTAYQTWAKMNPDPISSLPPERFHFFVIAL